MLQKPPKKTGFCIKTAQFQILTIQNTFKYTTAVIYTGESRKHPRNYGNQWQLKQKKTPLPPVNAPGWQRHKSRYFTNIYTIIEYIAHKISRDLLLIKVKREPFFYFLPQIVRQWQQSCRAFALSLHRIDENLVTSQKR